MSDNNENVKTFFHKLNIGDAGRNALRRFLTTNDSSALQSIFAQTIDGINHKFRAIIVELENENANFFDYNELHTLNPHLGSLLGRLLTQNDQGDKVISVYDRDRLGSMWQGSRYHQTREGGSIHTDNVNIPEIWDILYLSCISPALVGGENILVDGLAVHNKLKESFPKELAILEEDFIWEMRGVSESLYNAPIITYNDKNGPLFRHLRPYMESAHIKAKKPLSTEQLCAIDILDALTNSSEYQLRYRMKKGDILLTRDAQVLHGRTCFSDAIEAINYDDYVLGKGNILKRTMERLWIEK